MPVNLSSLKRLSTKSLIPPSTYLPRVEAAIEKVTDLDSESSNANHSKRMLLPLLCLLSIIGGIVQAAAMVTLIQGILCFYCLVAEQ